MKTKFAFSRNKNIDESSDFTKKLEIAQKHQNSEEQFCEV